MPHSAAFTLLAAALENRGYVEDGEDGGLYLSTTYRNRHSVVLDSSERLSFDELRMALEQQGVDMVSLDKAVDRLNAPDGGR